ncbi:hypothetical protein GALL_152130 [mine drainage metagenome]|uniref:Uncharacterized protein n=1 Tax=mine drainage metagenome TaxID=410659 RepID=A0A1J5S3C5_9ZZZZ
MEKIGKVWCAMMSPEPVGRADGQRQQEMEAALEAARDQARVLLAQLAPMYPTIASQTRDRFGAGAWVDSWARQIVVNGLTQAELDAGLQAIGPVAAQTGAPFSFSMFLAACRPPHVLAADLEARQNRTGIALGWNGQTESMKAARAAAFKKIQAIRSRRVADQ